jgi:hypothetical protein
MLKGDGADGEGGCGDSSGSGGGGGLSSLSAAEGRHSEAEAIISQAAAAADPAALFAAPPVLRLRGQTRLARCPVRSHMEGKLDFRPGDVRSTVIPFLSLAPRLVLTWNSRLF